MLGRRLDASAAELEIDGLRPYREGAPASRIHWPSVARTGEMLERRLVAELDSAPLVVVDPSAPSGEENLDKAIRAAASLCVHLAQVGGCAVLLPGDRRPIEIGHDMGAWPAVHVRLALVEAGAPPPTSTLGPRGGAVIWVTGADLNSAPRALERLPAGARIVVSPSALPGVRALFCVAECTGSLVEERDARRRSGPGGRREPGAAPAGRGHRRRVCLAAAPARPGASSAPTLAGYRGCGSPRSPGSPPFGAAHWVTLVDAPSSGRTLLVVAVAAAGGALLIGLGTPELRRRLTTLLGDRPRAAGALIVAAALLIGLFTIALGLAAAGLPVRLLAPGNWNELVDGLDRGLAGVQGVDWPYDGPEEWIRLTILLGAPLLLGLAVTLAFFPARRAGSVLRAAALVILLVLYGTSVTEHEPGAPMLRGVTLLLLVAAWLWLPRLRPREAAAAAAAVVFAGLLALPVAVALDGDRPWWNYRAWDWFGTGKAITFDWTHEYGPLDWPRDGTTLLNVRSDRPHYWKAETLDGFDGMRWVRTPTNDTAEPFNELPTPFGEAQGPTWDPFEYNPRWDEQIEVTVRSLSSDLIVGAGTTYLVDGVAHNTSGDGTSRVQGDPLEKGDSYTVRAYAPDPDQGPDAPVGAHLPRQLQPVHPLPAADRGGRRHGGERPRRRRQP